MKKYIITTVLLATLTAVNAQDAKPAEKATKDPKVMQQRAHERAEKRTATMTSELGLTEEQTAKVKVINDTFATEAAKLKQSGAKDEALKERMRIIRESRDRGLKGALTEEQYSKMLELRKAKKEDHEEEGEKVPHNE